MDALQIKSSASERADNAATKSEHISHSFGCTHVVRFKFQIDLRATAAARATGRARKRAANAFFAPLAREGKGDNENKTENIVVDRDDVDGR